MKKPQAELDNERTIPREYKKEMKDMLEELDSNDELYKRTGLITNYEAEQFDKQWSKHVKKP